jgi:hypothetical protein
MTFNGRFARARDVRVVIPSRALDAIFDECDRFEIDETGGRLVGSFGDAGGKLTVNVTGVIESGPDARRSNTSFFQDGAHQESVFRELEREHPEIEHLGNWHTHHVNGYASLSGGDVQTYQRTVNHPKHNTPFFYALLVTNKERPRSKERYRVKHYVLRRGDPRVYEIDRRHIEVTGAAVLWPRSDAPVVASTNSAAKPGVAAPDAAAPAQMVRAFDNGVVRDLYGRLRSLVSPSIGLYWRGPIELVDGSNAEVLVVESDGTGGPWYTVGLAGPSGCLKDVGLQLDGRRFSSASAALIFAERLCNHVLYAHANRLRPSEKGG